MIMLASDALVLAGTQDNGTLQFRNSPAFYYSAPGDGGFVAIDPEDPNNVVRQYVYTRLSHSSRVGQKYNWNKDTWNPIDKGLEAVSQNCLFYAPFTLDKANSKNIAFGADKIYLDTNQGLNRWNTKGSPIPLHGLLSNEETGANRLPPEYISTISYINTDPGLMYVGTNYGKVFRLTKNGGEWTDTRIDNFPREPKLTMCNIWDIATYPGDTNSIIVVMSGFGSKENPRSHVWRGIISQNGGAVEWTDINPRTDSGEIIDIPVNAVVIDDKASEKIYIGTDIGVFCTTDSGKSWVKFNEGLPNCAVNDMYFDSKNRLLRVATHGRGMWERKLDVSSMSDVYIFVRHHIMDTGRSPSQSNITSAFDDPLQNIQLGDKLLWFMCADIKIDPPFYKFKNVEEVDYVKFETELQHSNIQRERINHIYVQIHNHGIKSAGIKPSDKVNIKLLYASLVDSDSAYPKVPSDFWTGFLNNSFDNSIWKPIGEIKSLPEGNKTLTNTEPTVIAWKWSAPQDVADRICLLVVVDSPEDPIPEANKNIFDLEALVASERHIGIRVVEVANI